MVSPVSDRAASQGAPHHGSRFYGNAGQTMVPRVGRRRRRRSKREGEAMTITTHAFRTVARPAGVSSRYALLVVDGDGRPHLPLTQFYHDTQHALSDGT